MLPRDRIRALLLEHDDPGHLERPADFDLDGSRKCFARLVGALEERFGPSRSRGLLAQDASFYGVIDVSADAAGPGRPLRVLMSNFGNYFVTADVVADGAPSGDAGLSEEFVTWIDCVCTAMGCAFVPADLLREPYNGPSFLEAHRDEEFVAALVAAGEVTEGEDDDEETGKAYWADRYFAYM
ncbi:MULTISPECIES: hypothetical protein [unclassified Streptomyces]|uniref:hypothetical protein n=1 Tax=unclassified Streptomyces TaxID=2593676 RepID=UPI00380F46ED